MKQTPKKHEDEMRGLPKEGWGKEDYKPWMCNLKKPRM
jgi:hypothetical protein